MEHILGVAAETREHGQRQAKAEQVLLSYLEIYNERVFDLLESSERDLPLREDAQRNIIIPNLAEIPLTSFKHFETLYALGCRNRKTAATKLNAGSSRSHAVLIVKACDIDVVFHVH